jgi:hypothetical protein
LIAGVGCPRISAPADAHLIEWIAAHHQTADRAAAEAQHRELHSGAAEYRISIVITPFA